MMTRLQLDEGGYWELKLKGTPFWNSFNSEYALRVHRLICLMIQVNFLGIWGVEFFNTVGVR